MSQSIRFRGRLWGLLILFVASQMFGSGVLLAQDVQKMTENTVPKKSSLGVLVGENWMDVGNLTAEIDAVSKISSTPWPKNSNNSYTYSAGLVVGARVDGDTLVTRCNTYGSNVEFTDVEGVTLTSPPSSVSNLDGYSAFTDASHLGLRFIQRIYQYTNGDYIIIKYTIKNIGTVGNLSDVYVGFFADHDVTSLSNAADDISDYWASSQLSYIRDDNGDDGFAPGVIGHRLLSHAVSSHIYFSPGSPYQDPAGGDEKLWYEHMSSGLFVPNSGGFGDYRYIQSTGPFAINIGDSIVVATAICIGSDSTDVTQVSQAAQNTYDSGFTAPENPDIKPHPVFNLLGSGSSGNAELGWDYFGEHDLNGFRVKRSISSGGPYTEVGSTSLPNNSYTDDTVTPGNTYYYIVQSFDNNLNESIVCSEVEVTSGRPSAPAGLSASSGDGVVNLNWDPNSESDIDGYNVYRSETRGGPYSRINASLISGTAYDDVTVDNYTVYYYVVTAVTTFPLESEYSGEVTALPNSGLTGSGVLLVNGIDWNTYSDGSGGDRAGDPWEMYNARALTSTVPFDFWDLFDYWGDYPPGINPIGTGSIPATEIFRHSTMIWVGNNYLGDLAFWNETLPIMKAYLQAGGHLLVPVRMMEVFVTDEDFKHNYCRLEGTGPYWTIDLSNPLRPVHPDLPAAVNPGNGFNNAAHATQLFIDDSGLSEEIFQFGDDPNIIMGVRSKFTAEGPWQVVLVSGRAYRLDLTAQRQNYYRILTDWFGELDEISDILPIQITDEFENDQIPSACQTATGRFVVVYQRSSIWMTKSDDEGANWSAPEQIVEGGFSPSIAELSDGKLMLVYNRDGEIYCRTSSTNGDSWSGETKLSTNPDYEYGPRISAGPGGKVAVAWTNNDQVPRQIHYRVSTDNGASWSEDRQFPYDPNESRNPSVAYNPVDGDLYLVWMSFASGNQDLWYSKSSDNGVSWMPPEQLTDHPDVDSYPSLVFHPDGTGWLVWETNRHGNWDIYCEDGEKRLTAYEGNDRRPSLCIVSGESDPAVVWYSNRAGNNDIWAGMVDTTLDLNPPPATNWWNHHPALPDQDDVINIQAGVRDEWGVADVEFRYWVNGALQTSIPMNPSGGDVYECWIGPYAVGTHIDYQILASDIDGNNVATPSIAAGFDVVPCFGQTSNVLLVVDDISDRFLNFYTEALNANGYSYDVWQSWGRGVIDSTTLKLYSDGVVIWYCGHSFPVLTGEDRTNLSVYLNSGGNLFLTEQDVGYDLWEYDQNPDSTWFKEYLHARYVQDATDVFDLGGIAGDPISDGLSFNIMGGDGANNQYWPSEIDPISPAEGIFYYYEGMGGSVSLSKPQKNVEMLEEEESDIRHMLIGRPTIAKQSPTGTNGITSTGCGGVRMDAGVYKMVYLAFGFEGINSGPDRATVMGRIVDWLMPSGSWSVELSIAGDGVEMTRSFGGDPSATEGYDDGLDVVSPPVPQTYYAYFQIGQFPNYLSGDIRGWVSPYDTDIDWTLRVVNAEGLSTSITWNPEDLPSAGFFTLIGASNYNMRRTNSVSFEGNRTLTIQYRSTVQVMYDFEQQGWYMVSLPVFPQDSSVAVLFPTSWGAFTWNTTGGIYDNVTKIEPKVGYWLAIPGATSNEVVGLPLNSYTAHYPDQGWYMIGSVLGSVDFTNPEDTPDGSVLVPAFGWNTGSSTYYQSPSIDEKEAYWIAVMGACDLTVGGGTGELTKTLAKADWTGFMKNQSAMPPSPPNINWETGELVQVPTEFRLSQNYPNPFNPETTIEYQLPKDGMVTLIIYNMVGQEVRRLVDEEKRAGYYKVVWDGRSDSGIHVGTGIYLIQIRAGSFSQTRKLLLVQ